MTNSRKRIFRTYTARRRVYRKRKIQWCSLRSTSPRRLFVSTRCEGCAMIGKQPMGTRSLSFRSLRKPFPYTTKNRLSMFLRNSCPRYRCINTRFAEDSWRTHDERCICRSYGGRVPANTAWSVGSRSRDLMVTNIGKRRASKIEPSVVGQ